MAISLSCVGLAEVVKLLVFSSPFSDAEKKDSDEVQAPFTRNEIETPPLVSAVSALEVWADTVNGKELGAFESVALNSPTTVPAGRFSATLEADKTKAVGGWFGGVGLLRVG